MKQHDMHMKQTLRPVFRATLQLFPLLQIYFFSNTLLILQYLK